MKTYIIKNAPPVDAEKPVAPRPRKTKVVAVAAPVPVEPSVIPAVSTAQLLPASSGPACQKPMRLVALLPRPPPR